MVSARPPPKPKQGRVAYPSAQTYTVGDTETAPTSHSPPPSAEAEHEAGSLGPIPPVLSGGSANAGESTGGVRRKGTLSSRKGSVSGSSGEHDRWDREDRLGEREAGTQGLKSWWKSFRDRAEPGKGKEEPTVFGTELGESLKFASVQILTAGPDGGLNVWGCVPVVVAKCGLYLKEHATEVEGTFRVSGSAKRMKELQAVFDSAPKYGKDLTWKDATYTTHDVATIFRRYLTQMPEPIIPFDNYHDFRACLTTEPFVEEEAIKQYKELIRALPPANQYLLLYVLDLLSVFAKKSDLNLMTAPNLALIFQPGVINHPDHAMRPSEHGLSQRVLEFLIEHQDQFSIGMQLAPVPAGLAASSSADSPSDAVGASIASPPTPAPPRLVRADSDLMLPSDSDDDAPEGGYYVHEREQFVPRSPVRPLTGTSGVIPAAPPARAARTLPDPDKNIMEPSDSDEDAPPGGYLVKTGDPATGRQTFLSRSKTTAAASPRAERRAGGLSPLPADRSSQGSPHARLTPSPSAPGSAGSGASIARRRTAPTRRTGEGEGGGSRVRKSKGSEAPL